MPRRLFLIAITAICLLAVAGAGDVPALSSDSVTFSKDVAPIFYKKCVNCHRSGENAPMSLLTYKEARPWARSIREKVVDGSMPPWHADFRYGSFKNDRRLSKTEAETIVDWVDEGAKEGNPKDLPPAPAFTDGWQIGKPDVVLSMPQEYNVPAQGPVSYQYFRVPTRFTRDKWIAAVEVRPGNRAVVHHVIVLVVQPSGLRQGRALFAGGGIEGLIGTAPGEQSIVFPDGVGKLIKAGSTLVFQMHYTPNGVAQKDRTSIGLLFSRKPIEKAALGAVAMNPWFAIPPGEDNYAVRSSHGFDEDAHIVSLAPHMHLRGKDFTYRLVDPDGTSKIILSVPRFDFNWQTRYEFREPVAAPLSLNPQNPLACS